jgi:hypothetical protein
MVDFLDETIRQSCNDVGGYWVTTDLDDYDERGKPFRMHGVHVCRIPQDVIEDAVKEVKTARNSNNKTAPCRYFRGIHHKINLQKDRYPDLDLRRLVFPEGTTILEVCDILYSDWVAKYDYKGEAIEYNELFPLTYPVAYNALIKYARHPKEKIYDNYDPTQPNVLLIKHPKTIDEDEHYHINYEGNQERLYGKLKKNIFAMIGPELELQEDEDCFYNWFKVVDKKRWMSPFKVKIYIGLNAVPRIKIFKYTDAFDKVVSDSVNEIKTDGQMIGKPD